MKVKNFKISKKDGTLLSRFTGDINYIRCEKDGIDWIQLMSLVEEIEKKLEGRQQNFSIDTKEIIISTKGHSFMTDIHKKRNKISAVYTTCIGFIKWYNEDKIL